MKKIGIFVVMAVLMTVSSNCRAQEKSTYKGLGIRFGMGPGYLLPDGKRAEIEAAQASYQLAKLAFREGEYVKSGFLFLDSAIVIHKSRIRAPKNEVLTYGLEFIYHGAFAAFEMTGNWGDVTAELDRDRVLNSAEIFSVLNRKNHSRPDAGDTQFDGVFDPCLSSDNSIMRVSTMVGNNRSDPVIFPNLIALPEALAAYRAGDYGVAADKFFAAADEFKERPDLFDPVYAWGRSTSFYCAAVSLSRGGLVQQGIERLCQEIELEPDILSIEILKSGIQTLAGKRDVGIRELCRNARGGVHPVRTLPELYRDYRGPEDNRLEYQAQDQLEAAAVDWLKNGKFLETAGAALAMGVFILTNPEDTRWDEWYSRRDCRYGPCSNLKETTATFWIELAGIAFVLADSALRAKAELERISRSVPSIFSITRPNFFHNLYSLYMDLDRSLLREGIDMEYLSLSTSRPILHENFPSLNAGFFPKGVETKTADAQFEKGRKEYKGNKFWEAARSFFNAAMKLEMRCETALCRDALWVWHAHAVWNGVTCLRQLNNPAIACDEAKRFVALAGEGHMKSAAADVQSALCEEVMSERGIHPERSGISEPAQKN